MVEFPVFNTVVWFQCVCPLMPSCNTYHIWVSLTLGVGLSLHGCSSKAQPLILTLDEGYLLSPPFLTFSEDWLL